VSEIVSERIKNVSKACECVSERVEKYKKYIKNKKASPVSRVRTRQNVSGTSSVSEIPDMRLVF
jgi:hypothetical protein